MHTDLIEVKELFDKIANTSGKNDKIKIIKQNKDNELFVECLKFLLDSDIVTGLSKKKIGKKVKLDKETTSDIRCIFDYLKQHNTGTDEDITTVQSFTRCMDEDLKEFCNGLFTKSLKVGVDVKGVNKAIPNLIPSFDIMLGSKGELDKLPKGMKFVTEKYDGVRCFTQIRDGKIIMKSRQNKVFEGLVEIVSAIADLGLDNVCLDGELLAIDSPYETVYKDTMKIVSTKDEEKHGVKYMLFDIIPLSEFDNKEGKTKYSDRRAWLNTIKESRFINVAPILYKGTDIDEVLKVLDECRGNGAEGCMINTDKPYEFKRSKVLQKLKVMSTCDLKVIGFEEGDGKLKGTLGKIICNYKGFDLGVGSGFSEAMRDEVWNNQDKYLGKISEIQYFEETNNDEGGLSLRFPVFKQWRFDKEEESYE